ncbi:hypothetical protein Tco_0953023 [Tanacetum coccineum]|uniref:Uncharacterized protein n=1 Tax=Tanacetum coccineum TaxID=301880 RepID=A0ABQ5E1I4_9ASTR
MQQGEGGVHGSGKGGASSSGDALNTHLDENINGLNDNVAVDGGAKSLGNGGARSPNANVAATATFSPTGLEFQTVSESHGIHSPASANEENMKDVGTTLRPTPVGITFGMSSFANVTAISERFSNTAFGFFWGKRMAYLIVANYVKLHGVPVTAFSEDGLSAIATILGIPLMLDSYTFDMCLQSWGRSSYARAMIELRANVELKDDHCVLSPKLTEDKGTSNLARIGANSSVSSFWNVETSSISTTPIIDKIGKLEKLILDGKVTLLDDDSKPMKKVDYLGDHDSEDEVESVDNDMARSMASERVSFCTKKFAGINWRDSYENDAYDEYPYE